ncbi:helix-turn-helix transcriptional regulator [Zobellia nedashkovskayae]
MSTFLLQVHIQKKLSIHEIASSSGLSVSHFCLLFKKKTSHTPIEHFTFLKMQRACLLLDFSTLRINEIAIDIGYDDPYYFTRVFKRVMGKSPLAYRHNNK